MLVQCSLSAEVAYLIRGGSVLFATCDDWSDPAPCGIDVGLRGAGDHLLGCDAQTSWRLVLWRGATARHSARRDRERMKELRLATKGYEGSRDNPPQVLNWPNPKTNSMARETPAAHG